MAPIGRSQLRQIRLHAKCFTIRGGLKKKNNSHSFRGANLLLFVTILLSCFVRSLNFSSLRILVNTSWIYIFFTVLFHSFGCKKYFILSFLLLRSCLLFFLFGGQWEGRVWPLSLLSSDTWPNISDNNPSFPLPFPPLLSSPFPAPTWDTVSPLLLPPPTPITWWSEEEEEQDQDDGGEPSPPSSRYCFRCFCNTIKIFRSTLDSLYQSSFPVTFRIVHTKCVQRLIEPGFLPCTLL